MIVSVTALGSRGGDATAAVARVVDYLDGRCPQPPGRSPQWWQDNGLDAKAPCNDGLGPASNGAVSYYADSVEGPATWMGRGLAGFSPANEVSRSQLARMLLGQHPSSGRQLLDGRGSAARADHLGRGRATVSAQGPNDERLRIPQAASLLESRPRATVELERTEVRAAALQEQAPAREALRQRLDAVEAALDTQVEKAVAAPAPYLTAVLGKPPEEPTTPSPWREAAVRIETYRHAELGRDPAEGPVVDEPGLVGAIGPRPEDYLGTVVWDHVAEVTAPELAPELEPPALELGLWLPIDNNTPGRHRRRGPLRSTGLPSPLAGASRAAARLRWCSASRWGFAPPLTHPGATAGVWAGSGCRGTAPLGLGIRSCKEGSDGGHLLGEAGED